MPLPTPSFWPLETQVLFCKVEKSLKESYEKSALPQAEKRIAVVLHLANFPTTKVILRVPSCSSMFEGWGITLTPSLCVVLFYSCLDYSMKAS